MSRLRSLHIALLLATLSSLSWAPCAWAQETASEETSAASNRGQEEGAQESATPTPPEPAVPESVQLRTLEQEFAESPNELVEIVPDDRAATLTYFNRSIVTLRARLLGRDPAERVASAIRRLDQARAAEGQLDVDLEPLGDAYLVRVDGVSVFSVVPQDVDDPAIPPDQIASLAASELRRALAESVELRTPVALLQGLGHGAAVTLLFVGFVWVLSRLRHRVAPGLAAAAGRRLFAIGRLGQLFGEQVRIDIIVGRLLTWLLATVTVVISYLWFTYVMRLFPWTRPWGEALGGFLLATLEWVLSGFVAAIPGLFAVLVIILVTRLLVKLSDAFFRGVYEQRIRVPWLDPDVSRPTRNIARAVLWIFALVLAYPYLPGSGTEAFRGISVFVGLVVSLGSTGVVSQGMSGLILMYSGALKPGDYVRIGEVEGTVMQLGMLSTRLRTLRRELVTLPNSVIIAKETTNYSRLADHGVAIRTTITIGYDVPWRQMRAILRLAAERTSGVRTSPAPRILQTELADYYVAYELIAFIDDPRQRPRKLSEMHAHLLDLCNEYGVQIMSPHYIDNPESPFVVPPERWAPEPAVEADDITVVPDGETSGDGES